MAIGMSAQASYRIRLIDGDPMMDFLMRPCKWSTACLIAFPSMFALMVLGAMLAGASLLDSIKLALTVIGCGVTVGLYCPA
jgi:hypothetical protein